MVAAAGAAVVQARPVERLEAGAPTALAEQSVEVVPEEGGLVVM